MRFQWLTAVSLLFSVVALASPTVNQETEVHLRIEGAEKTIFEGKIRTRGHNVTTASGGDHHCDGTNNKENPRPGPTCTSALADAARLKHFGFDGTFFAEFDDFLITSIGGDAQTTTEFWGLLLNFVFTPVGGCQQEVKKDDHILWAFDAFNKVHFLALAGPATAHRNQPVVLTVIDGLTGIPVAGAEVNGQTSDSKGKISVTFAKAGVNGVKAEKSDSLRSNQLDILVLP
ncbi:hypothetical protein GALMADRAFT_245817 [Galerina marginata CBS 339.88]|uniref:Big-1 domain-containing protein n=1 Tax=Galerina marginata (strain CBS 339.88) TaxID=685588 RepID=A0A067TCQ2_GALM3|nr:hypothetical protein GALMADRAFT_245817 [Galerina marginata CBS 339.88]